MLQRLTTALVLLFCAVAHLRDSAQPALVILDLIASVAGIFLLVGLWTPAIGALIAVVEVWIAFLHTGDALVPILLAMLGSTLAIVGPGAWSVDARLFGRKHFKIHDR